jgi:diguanylate cyclase (GGDEF)-like protein
MLARTRRASIACLLWSLVFIAHPASAGSAKPIASASGELAFDDFLRRGWSTESGMPQITAADLVQDRQGFVWIGTEGGLARFDGEHFQVFNSANTPALSHQMVRRLHVDRDGRLWVSSAGNVLLRDATRTSSTGYTEIRSAGKAVGGLYAYGEFANGRLFVGGDHLFEVVGGTLAPVHGYSGPASALLVEGDTLWIGGTDGVCEWRSDSCRWHPFPAGGESIRVTGLQRWQGALWAATSHGLFRLADAGWNDVDLAAGDDRQAIFLLYADSHGNLWVSTQRGLLRMYDGQIRERIASDDPRSLPWIISAMEDRDGSLWFGSQTGGVMRLRLPDTRRFGTSVGLPTAFTWSIVPLGTQDLLVGTDQGVALFTAGHFRLVIPVDSLPNPVGLTGYLDRQDRLWVGTRAGLAVFAAHDWKKLQDFPEIGHLQVNAILQLHDGGMWVGTMGGLYRLDGNRLLPVVGELAQARIRFLYEDASGALWIGTENGLFQRVGDAFVRNAERKLAVTFITFIGRLRDGRMLVGTFNDGFAVGNGTRWSWLGVADGLPSAGVTFATELGDQLVIASLQGVYRLQRDALSGARPLRTAMLIDDRGGEPQSDLHRCCNGAGNSKGALQGGSVWLPTLAGLVQLSEQSVTAPRPVLHPVIDGLEHDGRLSVGNAVTLARDQRNWRIDYSAPLFVRPSALRFRHRLIGYDANWSAEEQGKDTAYTNLPPGNYRFEVAARLDGDSEWSAPASLAITMQPFWYETRWAKVGMVLLAVLLLWLLQRGQVFAMRLRQRHLETLVAARTRELDEANGKLAQASITDPLTGLHNRRYLDAVLPQMLIRSQQSGRSICCVLLDIDHFKRINDSFGHDLGDRVLQAIASLLTREARPGMHLMRWGGEEFLLVLESELVTQESPPRIMQQMQNAIAGHDWIGMGLAKPVGCSCGAALHPVKLPLAWTWRHTLGLADKALYLVKRRRRGGWAMLSLAPDAPHDLGERVFELEPEVLLTSDGVIADGNIFRTAQRGADR